MIQHATDAYLLISFLLSPADFSRKPLSTSPPQQEGWGAQRRKEEMAFLFVCQAYTDIYVIHHVPLHKVAASRLMT